MRLLTRFRAFVILMAQQKTLLYKEAITLWRLTFYLVLYESFVSKTVACQLHVHTHMRIVVLC